MTSEERRLSALHHLDILKTRERAFDDIASLAAMLFRAPIALVSLVEHDFQWFKACIGLDVDSTTREVSFCAHAIAQDDLDKVFVIPDATKDPRFKDNALVTGPPHIRMYVGAPLVTQSGQAIGSLCVIDRVPREPSAEQIEALRLLARSVVAQMELRRTAEDLRESEEMNHRLIETALDAVILRNADRKVTAWNPQAEQLFGVPALRAMGRPVDELINTTVEGASFTELCDTKRSGNDRLLEINVVRPDGTTCAIEVSITAMESLARPMTSIFARDITSRIEQQDQKQESMTREVAIFALAKLTATRDHETGEHIERVQQCCTALCHQLRKDGHYCDQIDDNYIRLLQLTSPLHDVGKIGIPDSILMKPGRLSDAEFEVMKQHTTIGAEAFEAAAARFPTARFLRMARNIAGTHHERFDGTGYPAKLKGGEIPLCGRIVALADVYDALTSKRVYKQAMSHIAARGIIVGESGSHFDPLIVQAFENCWDTFRAIAAHGPTDHQMAA